MDETRASLLGDHAGASSSPALALALIGAAIPALAQEGGDQAARYGAAIYAEFCQACHGPRGEAIAGGTGLPGD